MNAINNKTRYQPDRSLIVIRFALGLILMIGFAFPLRAQYFIDDLISCLTIQPEVVVHLEADAVLNPNVTVSAPGVIGGSWSIPSTPTNNPTCLGTTWMPQANNSATALGGNLQATFNGGNNPIVNISSNALPLIAGEYALSLRLVTGSTSYVKHFRFIVRRPIDIVFALDRSGSMECDTDEDSAAGWPGCSTGDTDGNASADGTRWEVMSNAIGFFVDKLDGAHTLNSDRLSVVYFDGDANTASALVDNATPFATVTDFRNAPPAPQPFRLELDNMNAGGNDLGRNGTSIGAGVVKAVNGRYGGVENPNRRQVILLFSDGEQNRGNWLRTTGTGIGRRVEQSSSDPTVILNLDDAATNDFEVISVSMLTAGTGPALLQALASPGGYFQVIPGEENKFGSDMATHAFNEIFNQFSPRLVGSRRMPLAGIPRADFTVNAGVGRLIFEAFYSGAVRRPVQARIYHDGVDVTSRASIRRTDHGMSFGFPLYELADLPSRGTWRVELSPPGAGVVAPGTEVTIFATADQHAIRFEAGTASSRPTVGQPLRPTLSLTENGQPVTNATVRAYITRPGDDLGDVLARTTVSNVRPTHNQTASCAEVKFGKLKREQPGTVRALLTPRETSVNMNHTSGGNYVGSFGATDVTGVYRIRYEISYESPRYGPVRRAAVQTRYVVFPPPRLNLEARAVKGVLTRETVSQRTVVTARPSFRVAGRQRFVGPGYASAFGTTNKKVLINAADDCDGNYTLRASGPANERFKLYLLDQEVFTGTVREFNAGGKTDRPVYVSISGGVTRPRGEFGQDFSQGNYGQLGLGRRFGGLLGLEVAAGYYGFAPDYNILGGTAYLNAYVGGRGKLNLAVGAGPGYYRPNEEDFRTGGSLRGALEYRLGRLSLGAEGAYFRLFEPEQDFTTLGLRARIGL